MSQVHDLQYSMNSMYTPSYSIGGLAVLADEPLSLDPQSVVSTGLNSKQSLARSPEELPKKVQDLDSSSTKSLGAAVKPVLPQYHKLKMNYFRKLNVIPIISPEDVLHSKENESEKVTEHVQVPKKLSRPKKPFLRKKEKAKWEDDNDDFSGSGFVPSFLPARNQSSEPILIPQRVTSRSPPSSLSDDDDVLSGEKEQSKSYISGACLGAQFSVAEEGSPDHYGVFFPSFEL